MAALLASGLAGVMVAAPLAGRYGLVAGVALVQALLLIGMTRTADVPAGRSSAALALVAGLSAAVYLAVTVEGSFEESSLTSLLVAMGTGFVALVIVQLARRDGRARLTASLTFGVAVLVLGVSAAGWLGMGDDDTASALLLLALTGVAVGAAIMIFPGPAWLWVLGGTIGSASVGLIAQEYVVAVEDANLGPLVAAVVAGACGLAATVGVLAARLLRDEREAGSDVAPSGLDHALVVAALPVALAAPLAVLGVWLVTENMLA